MYAGTEVAHRLTHRRIKTLSANCHVVVTVCHLYRQIVRRLESWYARMRRMPHAAEALPPGGIMGDGTILVRLFQRAQRSGQQGPISRPLRPMYAHVQHKRRGEPYAKSTPHSAISQGRGYDAHEPCDSE